MFLRTLARTLTAAGFLLLASTTIAAAGQPAPSTIDDAQHAFYSGQYETSAAIALMLRNADPTNLAAYELRTSALHFQLRRALGEGEDRDKLYKACGACQPLMAAFLDETTLGRAAARTRLEKQPNDETGLFFLGKLDLNYVWLRLGTLGQRTGWNEYWEARRSLDTVLKANPKHVRARIARAWIDYIVDTKMTRGFRWILGGGNKKRALATVREVVADSAPPYEKAEAGFGLWDMEVREKNIPAALAAARMLARDFPDNQELSKFLAKHDPVGSNAGDPTARN